MPLYQYLVAHRSLKRYPGALACQSGHACSEAIREVPVPTDTHLVALECDKAEELEELAQILLKAGIFHALIREPDPPYNGSATALATEPMEREKLKHFFSKFRILR